MKDDNDMSDADSAFEFDMDDDNYYTVTLLRQAKKRT